MADRDSSGKKAKVWLWYQDNGTRRKAERGEAEEIPARGMSVSLIG